MDLSVWIDRWADLAPDRTAVHFAGQDRSYSEMAGRIARLAAMLAGPLGIRPGQRVAHLGCNSPELIELVFACARNGAVLVPLNWRLAAAEHRYILEDCGASALLAEPDFLETAERACDGLPLRRVACGEAPAGWLGIAELLADAPARLPRAGRPDDELLVVYTSGTTGRPKGAVLAQEALFWNAVNATHAHDLTSRDHVLTTLPLFHVGGLNIQTLPALHAGGTVTLHRRFEPGRMLEDVAARRPTLTLMVPATMLAVVQHPAFPVTDLGSLRLIMAGSSTIPAALIRAFLARGVPVGQVYGATETAPIAVYLRAEDAARKIGAAGKPAVHCDVRLAGPDGGDVAPGRPGEILVRGRNLFRRYWNDPAATAAALHDGWFHTGDIARRDADGFIHVEGRKTDVIISGGENIYPAELENVLADCPEIQEAAVVGRADPRWGEVAVAAVVRRAGSALDADAVLRLFRDRLARFKHPRTVVFLDALPRNAMGKVLKDELRRQLGVAREAG